MTARNLAAAALLAAALAGCARSEGDRAAAAEAAVVSANEAAREAQAAADAAASSGLLAPPAPSAPPPPGAPVSAPEGTFLAYEHQARVRLPGAQIPAHIAAVRDACQQARFGDCAILDISQRGEPFPGGQIILRTAPAGVEALLRLAGEGGEIASRSTRAEDLAQQVADNRLTQARLENEHARLLEYQRRPDLKVADLLTISQRLADIEGSLQFARQEAAQQRHRIDTQRLTIDFEAVRAERSRSEIGKALADTGGIFSASLAMVIRVAAGLLPVAILAGVALGLLRWWWRRRRRA